MIVENVPLKVPFLICFKVASLANLHHCFMSSFNVFFQMGHTEVFLITFVTLYLAARVYVQNMFIILLGIRGLKFTLFTGIIPRDFDLLFILLSHSPEEIGNI